MKFWTRIKYFVRDHLFNMMAHCAPRKFAGVLYKRAFHRPLNWSDPQDINEKINWLKFYGDTSLWTQLADKYCVREYVQERGLADLLIPLYGHWDQVEEIDWKSLPAQFVMKTNNGSGDVLICKDKSTLDIAEWSRHFKKMLKLKFGYFQAEPHYNLIPPCIIAEKYLSADKQPLHSSSIIDYKVWSFDGKPAYVWVCYNRTHDGTDVAVYDTDWTFHPEYSISTPHYRLTDKQVPRPQTLPQMLNAAAVLSKGHPQVRVDFYEVEGKLYFGEMTMTAAAGFNDFYSDIFLKELGRLCIIKK